MSEVPLEPPLHPCTRPLCLHHRPEINVRSLNQFLSGASLHASAPRPPFLCATRPPSEPAPLANGATKAAHPPSPPTTKHSTNPHTSRPAPRAPAPLHPSTPSTQRVQRARAPPTDPAFAANRTSSARRCRPTLLPPLTPQGAGGVAWTARASGAVTLLLGAAARALSALPRAFLRARRAFGPRG